MVQNATVAGGVEHTFSCPFGGNPVPNIMWYSETETFRGKQFKTQQSGCYICVARNIQGISDNITQCLIVGKLNFFLLHRYMYRSLKGKLTVLTQFLKLGSRVVKEEMIMLET